MTLKCKHCGGDLLVSRDGTKTKCKFCGVVELIDESDAVKIQRIRSKTLQEIELEKRRLEAERIQYELELQKANEQEERLREFKSGKLKKVLVVFAIISSLYTFIDILNGFSLAGFISMVQAILYITAWLMGMQVIKTKMKKLYVLIAVIGFILILPFFVVFFGGSQQSTYHEPYDFEWSDIELHEMVPTPNKTFGEVDLDLTNYMSVTIHEASERDYKRYLERCIDDGYVIESEKTSTRYSAFNSEGYKLSVAWDEDDRTYSIKLDAPEEMAEFEWPTIGVGSLLPATKSNFGRVSWDNSETYIVHVGNMSMDDFNEYVKSCELIGFIVDYSRSEGYYSAYDSDGNKLSLRYLGFNVIEVSIKVPENQVIDSPNSENTAIEATEVIETSIIVGETDSDMINGMRKEFKEAMDSYEEFMDEYISFVKKYENSSNPMELLTDYYEYMTKLSDMTSKIDALGEEEMNSAETAYYIEVTTRVSQKLLSIN